MTTIDFGRYVTVKFDGVVTRCYSTPGLYRHLLHLAQLKTASEVGTLVYGFELKYGGPVSIFDDLETARLAMRLYQECMKMFKDNSLVMLMEYTKRQVY